jgi:D-alanyl-D-alanine carboxypeptidase/D-alanyl-D-alanine-endopeptidase (penicillin-binding protein 4)
MRGTVAEGKVFAKTGTLTYARNLSGYVTGADGKEYIFSLLFNNFTVPTANISMIQDRICILLANYRAED